MTRAMTDVLKRLIRARLTEPPPGHAASDWWLVEVGWINGVNPRTAEALVGAGLAVYAAPSWASEFTGAHIRLAEPGELNHA
jgi:hypothetical protein